MKKQYMKPSIKIIKMEPTDIICGSGGSTQSLSVASPDPEEEDTPTSTTEWGYSGIFGE